MTLRLALSAGKFAALVAQEYGAPPDLTPEEMELTKMMFHPVNIIIGLLAVIAI